MRRSYVIDVCLTCGAHAVYPFACGHRPERFDPMAEPWCVAVTVELTKASETYLRKLKVDRPGASLAPGRRQP